MSSMHGREIFNVRFTKLVHVVYTLQDAARAFPKFSSYRHSPTLCCKQSEFTVPRSNDPVGVH